MPVSFCRDPGYGYDEGDQLEYPIAATMFVFLSSNNYLSLDIFYVKT